MRILVACEYSGVVRDAFNKIPGNHAISCDLLPTESPGPHYQGDIFDILYDGFDLMVAHPPCDFLSNAGNRWLFEDSARCTVAERLEYREESIAFFNRIRDAPIDKIAIENPQPHPYVLERVGNFSDKVQPWMFGEPETKGVCLWLKQLPPLVSTVIETRREAIKHRLPPGPERAKLRAKFFPKIAQAMAEQWS